MEISDRNGHYAIADAVRFERIAPALPTLLGFYHRQNEISLRGRNFPDPTTFLGFFAFCDEGDQVTGGGFRKTPLTTSKVITSEPCVRLSVGNTCALDPPFTDGWKCEVEFNEMSDPEPFVCFVLCADLTP